MAAVPVKSIYQVHQDMLFVHLQVICMAPLHHSQQDHIYESFSLEHRMGQSQNHNPPFLMFQQVGLLLTNQPLELLHLMIFSRGPSFGLEGVYQLQERLQSLAHSFPSLFYWSVSHLKIGSTHEALVVILGTLHNVCLWPSGCLSQNRKEVWCQGRYNTTYRHDTKGAFQLGCFKKISLLSLLQGRSTTEGFQETIRLRSAHMSRATLQWRNVIYRCTIRSVIQSRTQYCRRFLRR